MHDYTRRRTGALLVSASPKKNRGKNTGQYIVLSIVMYSTCFRYCVVLYVVLNTITHRYSVVVCSMCSGLISTTASADSISLAYIVPSWFDHIKYERHLKLVKPK